MLANRGSSKGLRKELGCSLTLFAFKIFRGVKKGLLHYIKYAMNKMIATKSSFPIFYSFLDPSE